MSAPLTYVSCTHIASAVRHATQTYQGKEILMGRQQITPNAARALKRRVADRASILVVLGVAASVAGCKGEAAAVQEQVVRPVKIAVVAPATQGRSLTYSGVV